MSKHYTCDKCGYPMETMNDLTIGCRIYDICSTCQNEITKGLDGQGREAQLSQYAPIEKWKHMLEGKNPIDFLKKPEL